MKEVISRIRIAAVLLLMAGLQSLSAIEQESTAQNFAITPPAAWGAMALPSQSGLPGMRAGGGASADAELRQAPTSFRFLKTPTLSAVDENSDAYRAGRIAGRWLFYAFLLVVVIAVIKRLF